MGLFIVDKKLFNEERELMDSCFNWLRHECKAIIIGRCSSERTIEFNIYGDDIPAGNTPFDITCTMLVDKVLMFNIGSPNDYNTNT